MRLWKSTFLGLIGAGLVAGAFAQSLPTKPVVPSTGRSETKVRPTTPNFGLNGEHYVRIGGSEFMTDGDAGACWSNTWNPGAASFRWSGFFFSNTCFWHVYAWVHAPGGAIVDYVEFDYNDTNASFDLTFNVYGCDFHGECNSTPLVTDTSLGSGGNGHTEDNPGITLVDNFNAEYLLEAVFPAGGPTDGSLSLDGAIIGWKYQISPAPATATFNDVGTGDFGFQQIEALAASGITGGCQVSPPLYCPNDNLTRAQMAVFLAKALGLYWGGY
jgi:hypothetical protein